LNSVSKYFPDGLANSSGQVGKNFMLHPIAGVTGVWDDLVQSWAGNDAFCLLTQHFYETDPNRNFVRGYEMQVTRGQGPLISALGGFGLNVPWGKGHHERFDQVFGHVATVAVTCEDLPVDTNFVSIDSSTTDRFGVPSAVMNYQLEENSVRMKSHGLESAKAWLEAAGAKEVLVNPLLSQAGFHLMGTARMGSNPENSVVDQNCRSHDVPNLLVIDAGVFASSAAVNPTPTLQAVALRAADQLVKAGI
jgi:choline dehydrogenase-like flavoprotein